MPDTFHVKGDEEFRKIAGRLRAAGDRDLNKATSGAIRKVAKPIGQRVLKAGAESMPKKGGLAGKIGAGKVGIRVATGRTPAVSILLKASGYDLNPLDRGDLRHLVFGRKGSWVHQRVPAGKFTEAFAKEAPEAQRAVLEAANQTLDDVARGI